VIRSYGSRTASPAGRGADVVAVGQVPAEAQRARFHVRRENDVGKQRIIEGDQAGLHHAAGEAGIEDLLEAAGQADRDRESLRIGEPARSTLLASKKPESDPPIM
jgi:hypothetical protein